MTITVAGELDLASNLLCDLVDASCSRRGIRRLIIDLREVSFIDSAGLCALLSARERTQRSGREFVLLGPSRPVERLLDITRLDGDLPMVADERRAAGDDGRKTA
jgi:anti-anti-sigma factor